MRIMISCPVCVTARQKNNAAVLTLRNDNVYEVVCEMGHTQLLSLPQQKHEILFEFGVHAIVDGYYREAISSFAAALERYYEYFLRVVVEGPCTASAFDDTWKKISAQSERQLGGYIVLYLLTHGRVPELISDSLVKLRNNAIHKGYIPCKEEALKFGAAVSTLIHDEVDRLRRKRGEIMLEITRQAMYPTNADRANRIHSLCTYLNCLVDQELVDFSTYVDTVRTHNEARY